jgi:hypothetical protein
MRDSLKSSDYWDIAIEQSKISFEKMQNGMQIQGDNPKQVIRMGARASSKALFACIAEYSRGSSPSAMIPHFQAHLQIEAQIITAAAQVPEYFRKEWGGGYDDYFRSLSLAYLLNTPAAAIAPLRQKIYFFKLRDQILEALLTAIGVPDRLATNELIWPDAYEPLREALISDPPQNQTALMTFVEGWYDAMSDTAWHGSHNSKHPVYEGYWCFEAAAVTKLKGIPINKVALHPNFPADMLR